MLEKAGPSCSKESALPHGSAVIHQVPYSILTPQVGLAALWPAQGVPQAPPSACPAWSPGEAVAGPAGHGQRSRSFFSLPLCAFFRFGNQ